VIRPDYRFRGKTKSRRFIQKRRQFIPVVPLRIHRFRHSYSIVHAKKACAKKVAQAKEIKEAIELYGVFVHLIQHPYRNNMYHYTAILIFCQ
jgi:hypothetical protein